MKNINQRPVWLIIIPIILTLLGCGETKILLKGNNIYQYRSKQDLNYGSPDQLVTYKLHHTVRTKIIDKTDYYIIKAKMAASDSVDVKLIKPVPEKLALDKINYNPETSIIKDETSFRYLDSKFAVQTLSIPLKFRKALDDGTKFPETVETGVNIGFAPVMKWNYNVFNPTKKTMGKVLNTYSINTGLLLNLGATDLKTATNAPGLKSDRKSGTFSYGGFIMFGINNINFGYAVGWDKVLGEGSANWVYQNKVWHGLVIALDIIK